MTTYLSLSATRLRTTSRLAPPTSTCEASPDSVSGDGYVAPLFMTLDLQRAYELTDELFALDEPWRTRFIALIADRVRAPAVDGTLPPRYQIAGWLTNQRLSRFIQGMLRIWTHQN